MTSANVVSIEKLLLQTRGIQSSGMNPFVDTSLTNRKVRAVIDAFCTQQKSDKAQLKKIAHEVLRIAMKRWNQDSVDQLPFEHFHEYAAHILNKLTLPTALNAFIESVATSVWQNYEAKQQSHGLSLAQCMYEFNFLYRAVGVHSTHIEEYLQHYFARTLSSWEKQKREQAHPAIQSFPEFFSQHTKDTASRMLWWRL